LDSLMPSSAAFSLQRRTRRKNSFDRTLKPADPEKAGGSPERPDDVAGDGIRFHWC
jgi:hypothetical protein